MRKERLIVFLLLFPAMVFATSIPEYVVIFHSGAIVSILVDSHITKSELKSMILEFRKARVENRLDQKIPPTSPGLEKNKYFRVWLFVFSEPKWATNEMNKKGLNVDPKDPFQKEYFNHIRAFYYWDSVEQKEEGTIGFDGGANRSAIYEKLF